MNNPHHRRDDGSAVIIALLLSASLLPLAISAFCVLTPIISMTYTAEDGVLLALQALVSLGFTIVLFLAVIIVVLLIPAKSR